MCMYFTVSFYPFFICPFPIIYFLSLLFSSLASYICSGRRNEPSCRGGNDQLCKMCVNSFPKLSVLSLFFSYLIEGGLWSALQNVRFSGISLSHCKLSALSFLSTAFMFISFIIFFFIFSRHKSFSLQTVCFVFAVLSFYLTAAASVRNMLTSPS